MKLKIGFVPNVGIRVGMKLELAILWNATSLTLSSNAVQMDEDVPEQETVILLTSETKAARKLRAATRSAVAHLPAVPVTVIISLPISITL